ncbi:hypothetical protein H072_4282 [Dactylellina haptotyla CBS 200.50]|uniref:Uncharacterized protein n=1 Tax=Dactylellina haptotyla (strain CBS 200.50) TaxID=1284197 RepID=S8BQP3_DACHA|nr:hypothetical protein H072_4282 [Dactylellina haptotyla CBS 200.50]
MPKYIPRFTAASNCNIRYFDLNTRVATMDFAATKASEKHLRRPWVSRLMNSLCSPLKVILYHGNTAFKPVSLPLLGNKIPRYFNFARSSLAWLAFLARANRELKPWIHPRRSARPPTNVIHAHHAPLSIQFLSNWVSKFKRHILSYSRRLAKHTRISYPVGSEPLLPLYGLDGEDNEKPNKRRQTCGLNVFKEIYAANKRARGGFRTALMFLAIVFPVLHMSSWAIFSAILGSQGEKAAHKLMALVPNSPTVNSIVGILLGWKFGAIMLCIEAFCSMIGGTLVTLSWRKERKEAAKKKHESYVFFFVPQLELSENVSSQIVEAVESTWGHPGAASTVQEKPMSDTPTVAPISSQEKSQFVTPKVSWRLVYSDISIPGLIKPEHMARGRIPSEVLKKLTEAATEQQTPVSEHTMIPGSMAGHILA